MAWRDRINAKYNNSFYENMGYDPDEEGEHLYWAFRNLYHHILIYLEARGLNSAQELFKTTFS